MIIEVIINSVGISNIILFITLFLVISYLKFYFNSNEGKGKSFELIINTLLKLQLNKNDYFIINNVTLRLSENDTTQIDHIIVSRFGLFVIESKNFKGSICGKIEDKIWTQRLGRRSFPFQNPLLQNYKHTQSLINLLQIDKNKVFSIILFSALSKLKFKIENVLQPTQLINFIKTHRKEVYSKKDMIDIRENINRLKLDNNSETDRRHIENLNNRFNKNIKQNYNKISFILAILIFIIIGLLIAINFSRNEQIYKESIKKKSIIEPQQAENPAIPYYNYQAEFLDQESKRIEQNRIFIKKQELIVSRLEMYIQQYEEQYSQQLFPVTYYNYKSKPINNDYKRYMVKMYQLLEQEKSKLDY